MLRSAAQGLAVPYDQTAEPRDVLEAEYDRCAPALYRFFLVRTGGNADLASDLMQQVWLQALASGRAVPPEQLPHWLRAIGKNLLNTHWRRIARRPAHVPLPDPDLAVQVADRLESERIPPDELARREVRDQLLLAVVELDPPEQELLVEHYFAGASYDELADRHGCTRRAIEGRLYRARTQLRARLRDLD